MVNHPFCDIISVKLPESLPDSVRKPSGYFYKQLAGRISAPADQRFLANR